MDKQAGTLIGFDLTVPNATEVSDFYHQVIGWEVGTQSMGDYEDYYMKNPVTGDIVAGVCHNKGSNQHLPPMWLMYLQVADLDVSLAKCEKLGGRIMSERRKAGTMGEFVLIQDPAGAYVMLWA